MLDTIFPCLQGVGKNVLPTLPLLSQDDVSTIWEHVSEFVERQLSLHKGVQIPGLGTFTFMRQKFDVGNKFILFERPVFIMAKKLVQLHGLKQNKVYTPGDIPVIPLNFVMISLEGSFNRDTVEGCVKETLLFLSRSISIKQNVEFTFKGIGVLMIKDGRVKMRFLKEFLCKMDGSGTLAKALANRPGTVDSVLSSRESFRKLPNNVLAFPRIELKEMENKPPMETIVEEGEKYNPRKYKLNNWTDKVEDVRDILSPKKCPDRKAFSSGKAKGLNLPNKFEQSWDREKNMSSESLSSSRCRKSDNEMKPKTPPASACHDHNKAGQELCYICLQRTQQNSPLYFSEERRRREIEEEQLIQQYQMLKDQDTFFKHQMRSLANREQNQKNAAYNLGVAEAVRTHKNEKPGFYKSCLFDKRPFSPEIKALKQEEHIQGLLKQIDTRREKEIKQRENKELMERLEQVQLTEELAAQRAKYIQDKMEEKECYKRALDAQIKNRFPQLPISEPDSFEPLFGRDETELMVETRKREQNCMRQQQEAAASHKRKAILNHLVDQKRDLLMLQKTQQQHLADRDAELERVKKMNQSLLEDWKQSAEMKRQRDWEEKAFERASDKLFLLDQCDKYRRCKQCQRSTSNGGHSHQWPLKKHLQGSGLFV
ncbi:coiled-coil domain-containing protein 81 [Myotis myotis]|uniref:Coiled-coil domain containing 81 n=1 Tax=Myotis myotis TaxID=51298 RepID=A0A7J7VGS0_MYOMY|nr:coiled-coil domain-containing protein 81 [Myotis myotis]KAF6324211.1 coiled-coil domain containing 81 [Myotis myotis]